MEANLYFMKKFLDILCNFQLRREIAKVRIQRMVPLKSVDKLTSRQNSLVNWNFLKEME
jgi:hypothetical protein